MKLRFSNGSIVTNSQVVDSVCFNIADGHVTAIDSDASGATDIDLEGGWLVPGFVDTQVNGGGGILFNDDISIKAIAAMGAVHARFGTTSFLPTLISDSPEHIASALKVVDAAISAGVAGVVGVHLEGPFINEKKRGIHETGKIRGMDADMIELLSRPRLGRVVLTVAPEIVSPADIRTLTNRGVIVCIGHSDATYDQVIAAIDAGARGFTHLFNAMSPLTHRAPGVVGAAFDATDSYCGLIVDNVHLHPATVRIAVQTKTPTRIMLVTDAMPSVGTLQASFTLQGKHIDVRDGACTYDDGTLAGSDLDMATAFRNTVAITGMTPAEVVQMASRSAAEFLGIEKTRGSIDLGKRADWVWLDRELYPRGTWIGGLLQDKELEHVIAAQ